MLNKENTKFLSIQEFLPHQENIGEHIIANVELVKYYGQDGELSWVSPTVSVKISDGSRSFGLPGEIWDKDTFQSSLANLIRIKEVLSDTVDAAYKLQEALKDVNTDAITYQSEPIEL